MRIAVFVDMNGDTLSFDSSGMVLIYENNHSDWQCIHKVPFCINKEMNIAGIRESIYRIAPNIFGCKALIAKRRMGIFNAIFEEELHIRLFAIEGYPVPFLDKVKETLCSEIIEAIQRIELNKQKKECLDPVLVGDFSKGCYQINMVNVQEKNASMNSKEILLPFLQNKSFSELEVICLHVPKWFDKELHTIGLSVFKVEWKDAYCHAFIHPISILS
jgi:Fe-only nitrogenase accessory protein AnfO